jgi:hypothetical protein
MRFLYSAATLLVLSGTATAKAEDFRSVLASRLSANAEDLVLNLPPRPDAWPGAIFTWNLRIPIKHGDPKDPALKRGAELAINASEALDASVNAGGGYGSWLGLSTSAKDIASISMSLPDARVVDMDWEELIKHAQASKEALAAANRGQTPVIVIKSYEATPVITLTRKSGASADAWAKLKRDAQVGVKADAASDDTITYKGSQPIVFAFETEQVLFDPNDLSHGKLTIKLAALPAALFATRELETDPAFFVVSKNVESSSKESAPIPDDLARVLRATIGVSVKDIQVKGILGGPNSIFRKPFG